MNENLYDSLGVASTASHAEIRKAYRKLAVQYHPDRNPSTEAQELFRKITKAYEVLNDPTRRDLYDRFGDVALNPNFKGFDQNSHSQFGDFSSFFSGFGGGHGTQPYEGSEGYSGQSGHHHSSEQEYKSWQDEPYETFSFGTGGRTRTRRASDTGYVPPRRGADISVELKIGFVESLRGCTKQVKIARQSRWKKGSNAGVHQEMVTIAIPAGTESESEIRMRGKGNYGEGGGDSGDLVAKVTVQPHLYLSKLGSDLYLTVPLSLKEAIEGVKVDVPTLDGSLKIQIPPGAQLGQKLRLKQRGLTKKAGGKGDLYLVLRPQFPSGNLERLAQIADEIDTLYPPQGVRGDFSLDE